MAPGSFSIVVPITGSPREALRALLDFLSDGYLLGRRRAAQRRLEPLRGCLPGSGSEYLMVGSTRGSGEKVGASIPEQDTKLSRDMGSGLVVLRLARRSRCCGVPWRSRGPARCRGGTGR